MIFIFKKKYKVPTYYKKSKIDGVRVAKIKNAYLHKNTSTEDKNSFHHYLVYTDKYTGKNVAVATSHLYEKDGKRFKQLRQGAGIVVGLPGFSTPSLVRKQIFISDVNNKEIDFANRNVHIKSQLSKSKAKKIYSFVNNFRAKKKANKKATR